MNICRVFNLYGNNDEFSIIEKLKNLKNNNNKLDIYNNGLSLRDFIHIDIQKYIKILLFVPDQVYMM